MTASALFHAALVSLIETQPLQPNSTHGFELEARIVSPTQQSMAQSNSADQQEIAVHHDSDLKTPSSGLTSSTISPTSSAILRDNKTGEISNHIVTPTSENSGSPAIPLPPDHNYYPASQLDVRPTSLAPINPEFPPDAAAANLNGRVVLLVLIDETGTVNEASIVEANPADYFEESALIAVQSARFEPGQRFNQPVKSRVLISINYDESKRTR